jgi:tetratricopeptide (TPR) repeat protein
MLNELGLIALRQGDVGTARALAEEGMELAREAGEKNASAWTLLRLGHIAEAEGDREAARALYEQSLTVSRETEQKLGIGWALFFLGRLAHWHGDNQAAGPFLKESLAIMRELGHRVGIAANLEGLAGHAVQQGQAEHGARLFGAAEAAREAVASPLQPDERAHHDRVAAEGRAALGEEAFAAAWTAGRAFTLEQAFAEAMEEPAPAIP